MTKDLNHPSIDAKSGTTGAGRAPKEAFLYCEVTDGIQAYGVASHRYNPCPVCTSNRLFRMQFIHTYVHTYIHTYIHTTYLTQNGISHSYMHILHNRHSPEIEQGLSEASDGNNVIVNFTPHLMPMSRGILETIYVKLSPGKTAADLKKHLSLTYENEPFVHVLEGSALPQTRHVRGSNLCIMNVVADRVPGRAIIVSAIDNLVKGASGQAIQNMNLMLDFPETTALNNAPLFP